MSTNTLSVSEFCDRIKYQHELVQSQYNSMKIEAEKLKSEKTDVQQQAKKFYESAYYLNIQNHKLSEVNSRLVDILNKTMTLLPENQANQLRAEIEEANKVSVSDLEKRIKLSQGKDSEFVDTFDQVDLYIDDSSKQYNDSASRALTKKFSLQHDCQVSSLCFSKNGTVLYTAGKGCVKKWDINDSDHSRPKAEIKCLENSFIRSMKFSSDETLLLVSGQSRDVVLIDLTTQAATSKTLQSSNSDTHYSLAITPDSRYCFSCLSDGNIAMWEISSGRLIRFFSGHEKEAGSVGLTPDGKILISSGLDQTVRLWDCLSGQQIAKKEFSAPIYSMSVCPQKYSNVAVGLENGVVNIFNYGDFNSEVTQLRMHESNVLSLSYAPTGDYLAAGGRDKWVSVWKAPSGPPTARMRESNSILTCDISVNNLIATGSWDKYATVYSFDA